MDLSHYLPEDLLIITPGEQQGEKESCQLKERVQNQAIEMQQVTHELFEKTVEKRKLETSNKSLKGRLDKESVNLETRMQDQNNLAQLVNTEQEKQKALEQQATEASNRIKVNKRKIQERRREVDGYGRNVIQSHDSIQSLNGEIATISWEIQQFKRHENELVSLNVALAKSEREMRDFSNSIKVTEVMIVKVDVSNQRQLKDIEVLEAKMKEVESILARHLLERARLQKELEEFSVENKISDKLDELEVVLQRHEETIMEMQNTHDEQTRALEQQKKEAVAQNEAYQKAIAELDGTLAQQVDAQERAEEELSLLNSDRAQDDPVLRVFQLDLEGRKCEVNQLEEQIMHVKDELDDLNYAEESDFDISIPGTETLPDAPTSTDGGDTLRTSTPQWERLRSAKKLFPNDTVTSRPSGSRLNMSFGSAMSMPSTIPASGSPAGGGKRRRNALRRSLDVEVSSTQR